jgi:hypothetical protein
LVTRQKRIGQDESGRNIANEIFRQSKTLGVKVEVAVAANVDVAIHAARLIKGVTIIPRGDELLITRDFSIKKIDHSLVSIDEKRAAEIQETFALWGIRTFGDLARLPLSGVAERLGQEGVRLQKMAQGKSDRRLNLSSPPIGFAQSLELEHAISEVEPLSFILSRLLNQLCAQTCMSMRWRRMKNWKYDTLKTSANRKQSQRDVTRSRASLLPCRCGTRKRFCVCFSSTSSVSLRKRRLWRGNHCGTHQATRVADRIVYSTGA